MGNIVSDRLRLSRLVVGMVGCRRSVCEHGDASGDGRPGRPDGGAGGVQVEQESVGRTACVGARRGMAVGLAAIGKGEGVNRQADAVRHGGVSGGKAGERGGGHVVVLLVVGWLWWLWWSVVASAGRDVGVLVNRDGILPYGSLKFGDRRPVDDSVTIPRKAIPRIDERKPRRAIAAEADGDASSG